MEDKNIPNDPLADLLRTLPGQTPPTNLSARIMEQLARQKTHAERRTERRGLVWAIALSTLVLTVGGWMLYIAGGGWPRWNGLSAHAWGMLRMLVPGGAIVLTLLLGDLYLRRWLFLHRERGERGGRVVEEGVR